MKNENVNSEMIEIMQAMHQYVPTSVDGSTMVDGVPKTDVLEQCLLGDQLTCERTRSAKQHRQDSATTMERLCGLEPVVEDWHTKMCLFEVIKTR